MAGLIRTFARFKSCCCCSSSLDSTANKQIVSIGEIENHLQNWSIPKTPVSNIYIIRVVLFLDQII